MRYFLMLLVAFALSGCVYEDTILGVWRPYAGSKFTYVKFERPNYFTLNRDGHEEHGTWRLKLNGDLILSSSDSPHEYRLKVESPKPGFMVLHEGTERHSLRRVRRD